MKEHKKKHSSNPATSKYPASQSNLVDQPFDITNQEVLYTNEYLVRRPIFYSAINEGGTPEQVMDFQESTVHYTKIKNNSLFPTQNSKEVKI